MNSHATLNLAKQYLFIGFFFTHFVIILLVSINSSTDSYTTFYDIKKTGIYKVMLDVTAGVVNTPGISQYANCAGIDAGYGFFAPNVASEYVLEYKLYSKNKQLAEIRRLPGFKNKESIMRYSTMLGGFQEKLLAINDTTKLKSLRIRYLDVLVKAMGRNILKDEKDIVEVKGTLFLYDFPSLESFHSGDRSEVLVPFTKFNIFRK